MAPSRPATRSELHRGVDGLDAVLPELVRFERATGTPAPATGGWVRAAAVAGRGEPWIVVLRGPSDDVVGAAPLIRTGASTIARVSRDTPETPFRLATDSAARALAEGIIDHLGGAPWRLDVGGLPTGDPVAESLAALVPAARHEPAALVRTLDLAGCDTAAAALTAPARHALAEAADRARRDGLDLTLASTTHPRAVGNAITANLSPDQRFLHDTRAVIELTTLRIDGAVAAQALALLDPPSYRVLGGYAEPSSAAYAPAAQIGASVLARTVADPRYSRVEWAPSSLLGPPDPHCPAVPTWRLIAASR